MLTAIRSCCCGVCLFHFSLKESLINSAVYYIPRKNLINPEPPVCIEAGINSASLKDGDPLVIVKILVPGIEHEAFAAGQLQGVGQLSVTAGKDGLNPRDAGIVIIDEIGGYCNRVRLFGFKLASPRNCKTKIIKVS